MYIATLFVRGFRHFRRRQGIIDVDDSGWMDDTDDDSWNLKFEMIIYISGFNLTRPVFVLALNQLLGINSATEDPIKNKRYTKTTLKLTSSLKLLEKCKTK